MLLSVFIQFRFLVLFWALHNAERQAWESSETVVEDTPEDRLGRLYVWEGHELSFLPSKAEGW